MVAKMETALAKTEQSKAQTRELREQVAVQEVPTTKTEKNVDNTITQQQMAEAVQENERLQQELPNFETMKQEMLDQMARQQHQ